MLRIRFDNGVTVRGRPEDAGPIEGLFVAQEGFSGWDDGGGDVRRESIDRPSSHGAFDTPSLIGPRVVSIDGWALAHTDDRLAHLRSQVMGIAADWPAQITVDHRGQTLWAKGRRDGQPRFEDAGASGGLLRARFLIQLVCPDPRKYGDSKYIGPSSDPLTLSHYGNFPSVPLLRVSGVLGGGYTITGPGGRQIVVTTSLTAAQPHEIDMRTGAFYVGAARVLGGISKFEGWAIPPGRRVTASVSGGVALRATVVDTFI